LGLALLQRCLGSAGRARSAFEVCLSWSVESVGVFGFSKAVPGKFCGVVELVVVGVQRN